MKKEHYRAMGLALGLPTTILGVFAVVYQLTEKGVINQYVGLAIILLFLVHMFYLIIKNAASKKD